MDSADLATPPSGGQAAASVADEQTSDGIRDHIRVPIEIEA